MSEEKLKSDVILEEFLQDASNGKWGEALLENKIRAFAEAYSNEQKEQSFSIDVGTNVNEEGIFVYGTEKAIKIVMGLTLLDGQVKMGVGDGNGNLFVRGDYDSIKALQNIITQRTNLYFENKKLTERINELLKLKQQWASKIIRVSNELVKGHLMEAYHIIYSLASPEYYKKYNEVWKDLEDIANGKELNLETIRHEDLEDEEEDEPAVKKKKKND